MAAKKDTEYRLLLVGKSGSGKSSTANTITGENMFTVSLGLAAGTKTCEFRKSHKPQKGVTYQIADTPGLFDPTKPLKEIKEEIIKAISCLHPGLHAVLYVVRIGRYTPEERDTFNHLKDVFDSNVVKHVIIIFTGGDELKKNKMSLQDVLREADEPFKEVLRECGNRIVVFDNTKRDSKVIKELLAMVDQIWRDNGEVPYTCTLQTHVNENLEKTVSERTQERIEIDPALRKLFAAMRESVRKADKDAQDQDEILQTTIYKKQEKERDLEDLEAEKEKEEQKRKDREREEKEKQERAEKEKREQEDKQKREEEERERQRQEQERKAEEERARQRLEQETAQLRKVLEDLKKKQELEERMKEEKEKLKMKYDKKLEDELEKQKKVEAEKTKDSIAQDKEKGWLQNVAEGAGETAGGVWKMTKGWFGF